MKTNNTSTWMIPPPPKKFNKLMELGWQTEQVISKLQHYRLALKQKIEGKHYGPIWQRINWRVKEVIPSLSPQTNME